MVARALALSTLSLGVAVVPASAEPFSPAYNFTDSIGVNTHLAEPTTAYYNLSGIARGETGGTVQYGTATARERVKELLADLGVKHIRYDVCPTVTATNAPVNNCIEGNRTAREIGALGIKTLDAYFGVGPNGDESDNNFRGLNGGSIATEIQRQFGVAAADGNDAVIEAFEGPNERDRTQVGVSDWAARLSEAQYQAAAALGRLPGNPSFSALSAGRKLITPGLGSPPARNTAPLLAGFTGITGFRAWSASTATPAVDAVSSHTYTYTSCPEAAFQGANIPAGSTATTAQCADRTEPYVGCAEAKPGWRGCSTTLAGTTKPIWVTETGYTNSLDDINGMSEKASSIYLPRLLLEGWRQKIQSADRRGWDRVYAYELLDSRNGLHCAPICSANREAGHGLVASNYAPKLSYRALKNLIGLLGDTAPTTGGTGSAPQITVAPADQDVIRRQLFRKQDGTWVLALWRPVSVWRNARYAWNGLFNQFYRGSDIVEGTAPNTTATATITTPYNKAISIYRPSLSPDLAEPVRAAASTHQVTVRGDVTLVTWR